MKKVMSVKTMARWTCCHEDLHGWHGPETMDAWGVHVHFSLTYDYRSFSPYEKITLMITDLFQTTHSTHLNLAAAFCMLRAGDAVMMEEASVMNISIVDLLPVGSSSSHCSALFIQ